MHVLRLFLVYRLPFLVKLTDLLAWKLPEPGEAFLLLDLGLPVTVRLTVRMRDHWTVFRLHVHITFIIN